MGRASGVIACSMTARGWRSTPRRSQGKCPRCPTDPVRAVSWTLRASAGCGSHA